MATYKVPQDIEADDKLFLWLSFKQFVFGLIAAVAGFFVFFTLTKGAWPISIMLLPFVIVPGVLAAPLGRDQPTEVWLASRIRFFIKPRKRIWNQSGIKQLVTITAPKKPEIQRTDGLSQTEVKSRLEALANTLDSRGWAVKNVAVNLFAQPAYAMQGDYGDDRLVSMNDIPSEVPSYNVTAADDILDTINNPTAQRLSQQVAVTTQKIKSEAVAKMFGGPMPTYSTAVNPTITTEDENNLLQHLHEEAERKKMQREHVLQPIDPAPVYPPASATSQPATAPSNPAILNLAQNNDFTVSTIASQATAATKSSDDDQEVVVSLR